MVSHIMLSYLKHVFYAELYQSSKNNNKFLLISVTISKSMLSIMQIKYENLDVENYYVLIFTNTFKICFKHHFLKKQ